jgi:glycosyltransferase involved in cell wall biosynthesis
MNPLVSVLITAYNREKYISDAIKSVLDSSFENFELIIVDDCSEDGTYDIAFGFKDERIRLYKNESNLGQFTNRNKAASLAQGNFLKFVDSDDKIDKNCLQIFVNGITINKDTVFASVLYNEYLKKSDKFNKEKLIDLNPVDSFKYHYERGGLLFAGPTASLYKKDAFIKVGGFSLDLGINADIDLNFKLCAIGRSVFVEDCIFWRRHEDQIDVQQADLEKMLKERLIIDLHNLHNLKSNSFPESSLTLWKMIVIRMFSRNIVQLLINLKFNSSIRLIRILEKKIQSVLLVFMPTRMLKLLAKINDI